MAALTAALGGLAWQLLERDREAERAQLQDRLEAAADRVVTAVESRLIRLRGRVSGDDAGLPADVVVMSGPPSLPTFLPPGRLLFYPVVPRVEAARSAGLEAAEAAEFQRGDAALASRLYEAAAGSRDASVRAAALAGFGRALRKSGRAEAALDAYLALSGLGVTPVLGIPSELLASEARCLLLEQLGRREELAREAAGMADALWGPRYRLTPAAWFYYHEESLRFGAPNVRHEACNRALALSRAVTWAHEACYASATAVDGRHARQFEGEPVLVLCGAASGDAIDAVVAGPEYVRSLVDDAAATAALTKAAHGNTPLQVAFVDSQRHVAAGSVDRRQQVAVRTPDATTLPWIVYVSAAGPVDGALLAGGRRRLLLAAFGVLTLALATASYFIARSLRREHAVSALQSDFVSAVSHEFRTPLTALRQLSEMLADGRITDSGERLQSYAILARESQRLDHLVQSLLDFGRMEAGTHAYQPEPMAAAEFVDQVVSEFRASTRAGGFSIEVLHEAGAIVHVDRGSLALALNNVLDNAVKYSGHGRTVRVRTGRENGSVTISVTDEGIGLSPSEQHTIFGTFVRGSGARAAGIGGTGLGLALARRIVAAHGGEIRVASEPGCGSTFTMVLPAEGSS